MQNIILSYETNLSRRAVQAVAPPRDTQCPRDGQEGDLLNRDRKPPSKVWVHFHCMPPLNMKNNHSSLWDILGNFLRGYTSENNTVNAREQGFCRSLWKASIFFKLPNSKEYYVKPLRGIPSCTQYGLIEIQGQHGKIWSDKSKRMRTWHREYWLCKVKKPEITST